MALDFTTDRPVRWLAVIERDSSGCFPRSLTQVISKGRQTDGLVGTCRRGVEAAMAFGEVCPCGTPEPNFSMYVASTLKLPLVEE